MFKNIVECKNCRAKEADGAAAVIMTCFLVCGDLNSGGLIHLRANFERNSKPRAPMHARKTARHKNNKRNNHDQTIKRLSALQERVVMNHE